MTWQAGDALMKDAALGFVGGLWLRHRCGTMELPRMRCRESDAGGFRLGVSILAASISTLDAPGRLTRQRPRLEVGLGCDNKTTGFATFASSASTASHVSAGAKHPAQVEGPLLCPWRFDDTLVFQARAVDVLGPGLRFRLCAHSDVRLGPLEVEFAGARDLGFCTLDVRRRVLPACVHARRRDPDGGWDGQDDPMGGRRIWETPVLVLPLSVTSPDGGSGDKPMDFNQAVAHITLVCSVSMDPQAILQEAEFFEQPLAKRVAVPLRAMVEEPFKWVAQTASTASLGRCASIAKPSASGCTISALSPRASTEYAAADPMEEVDETGTMEQIASVQAMHWSDNSVPRGAAASVMYTGQAPTDTRAMS